MVEHGTERDARAISAVRRRERGETRGATRARHRAETRRPRGGVVGAGKRRRGKRRRRRRNERRRKRRGVADDAADDAAAPRGDPRGGGVRRLGVQAAASGFPELAGGGVGATRTATRTRRTRTAGIERTRTRRTFRRMISTTRSSTTSCSDEPRGSRVFFSFLRSAREMDARWDAIRDARGILLQACVHGRRLPYASRTRTTETHAERSCTYTAEPIYATRRASYITRV